jgi:RHS repeat-associated protein
MQQATVGGVTMNYSYNYRWSHLQAKQYNENVINVWDSNQLVMELDANKNVITKYIRAFDDLIKAENSAGTLKWYYVKDTHGNVVKLIDSTYKVTKSYTYDEFGNEKDIDAVDANPFRYCGEYYDKNSGTVYLRGRSYSPGMGRFLQMDSYAGDYNNPLSMNLWTYSENDAVNHVDPSGNYIIYENGSTVPGKYYKRTSNALVTATQLKKFGWSDTSDVFVKKLNDALVNYGITDKESITLFMATMAAESDFGRDKLEVGTEKYFKSNGYTANTRGAGYIQITGADTQKKFLKTIPKPYSGKDTASYIARNYALEASAWYWSNMKKTGEGNLNAYVRKNGGGLGVFLIMQFFVNGLPSTSSAFYNDLTSIRNGTSFSINKNGKGQSVSLSVKGNSYQFSKYFNWDIRKNAYDKATIAFK